MVKLGRIYGNQRAWWIAGAVAAVVAVVLIVVGLLLPKHTGVSAVSDSSQGKASKQHSSASKSESKSESAARSKEDDAAGVLGKVAVEDDLGMAVMPVSTDPRTVAAGAFQVMFTLDRSKDLEYATYMREALTRMFQPSDKYVQPTWDEYAVINADFVSWLDGDVPREKTLAVSEMPESYAKTLLKAKAYPTVLDWQLSSPASWETPRPNPGPSTNMPVAHNRGKPVYVFTGEQMDGYDNVPDLSKTNNFSRINLQEGATLAPYWVRGESFVEWSDGATTPASTVWAKVDVYCMPESKGGLCGVVGIRTGKPKASPEMSE